MKQSLFSEKFSADLGIIQLMDDLGKYVGKPGFKMLGGGNPARIPEIEAYFQKAAADLLADTARFNTVIGNYSAPGGESEFTQALAEFFNKTYGWSITADNIALTNGSATTFFYLFNMFSGEFADGVKRKILLPLAPEYIGYKDAGLTPDTFRSYRPEITLLDDHLFKYKVDFDSLAVGDDIGAICVSRPTNPTGNVLSDDEMDRLSQLALEHNIPFIVDNAYGLPFPNIIFSGQQPKWEPHMIMCMSLSKLGLPGLRTGIIIAAEPIVRRLASMNAVISLAPGSWGPALALEAVKSGEIRHLSDNLIRPYYETKVWETIKHLRDSLNGLDYYIHKPEGAIFVWLWFPGLPITSQRLYEKLRDRGVLVIPGEHFFPGLPEDADAPWNHRYECIRVSYAADSETVREGAEIIGEVVREIFSL
ncbi:MAG: valine--pyruvate aminotransferase [Cellvibrionaceae bacterium]|jgi:valine--pyruvate aminotransferase